MISHLLITLHNITILHFWIIYNKIVKKEKIYLEAHLVYHHAVVPIPTKTVKRKSTALPIHRGSMRFVTIPATKKLKNLYCRFVPNIQGGLPQHQQRIHPTIVFLKVILVRSNKRLFFLQHVVLIIVC